jgi:hypothetical protein
MRPRGKPNLYSVGPRYASAVKHQRGAPTHKPARNNELACTRARLGSAVPLVDNFRRTPSKTLEQFQRLLLDSDFHTRFAYLAWLEETS